MSRKINAMYERYGRKEGNKCKTCVNLFITRYDKVYKKCLHYGISKSDATDWNVGYDACGMYNVPFDDKKDCRVFDLIKNDKKENIVLDGQIKMPGLKKGWETNDT